ncbi:MAG: NACHT domain-containing protein, partial [Bacteroidota bacterium]
MDSISSEHLIYGILVFILIAIIFELILVNNDSNNKEVLANYDSEIVDNILQKKSSISVIPDYLSVTKFVNSKIYRFNIKVDNNRYNFLTGDRGISALMLSKELISEVDNISVVSGRGGYGKSTLLKQLTKDVASNEKANKNTKICLPFFIPLSDYNLTSDADIGNTFINTLGLNQITEKFKLKIILLLDGFNEIESSKFELLLKSAISYFRENSITFSIVVSTRPLSVKSLETILPKQIATKYYHLDNWTENQVKNYLLSSGLQKEIVDSIGLSSLDILRTPYIASLFVLGSIKKAVLVSNSGLEIRISDIVSNYIKNYFDQDFGSQIQVKPPQSFLDFSDSEKLLLLSKIAYELNNNSSLIFTKDLFDSLYNNQDSLALINSLENYGILSSSKIDRTEYKYKFTHQIIQEFLAANYVYLNKNINLLPSRPSENIFWFDVPVYLKDLDDKSELGIIEYLDQENDLFSIARIFNALKVDELKYLDRRHVAEKVVESLKGFDSYSRSPETIIELGEQAENVLINEVNKVNKKILSSEEILVKNNLSVKEEVQFDQNWRVVGRSIHLLSLYDSKLLLTAFENRIDEVESVHLKYHILEYLLRNCSGWKLPYRLRALRLLRRIKEDDPIIRYYKFHIKYTLWGISLGKLRQAKEERLWDETYDFVMSSTYTTNRKFFANFWIRNHGIECLSDFLPKGKEKTFFEGLSNLFELESSFHYPSTKPFYVAVFKSSLIAFQKLRNQSIIVHNGIENLVKVSRTFESS